MKRGEKVRKETCRTEGGYGRLSDRLFENKPTDWITAKEGMTSLGGRYGDGDPVW